MPSVRRSAAPSLRPEDVDQGSAPHLHVDGFTVRLPEALSRPRLPLVSHRTLRGNWTTVAALAIALQGCGPSVAAPEVTSAAHAGETTAAPLRPSSSRTQVPPQPTSAPIVYGPDSTNFPSGINPLTGQPVLDPDLLKIPAVLISISHFPPAARPQAGLSFAPYVYEFSITEGESRFLAAFYGEFPRPEVPITGECIIRRGSFTQTATLLGRRVWLDTNVNGKQDAGEGGVPGICVSLYDAEHQLIQETTTDTNGIYGFNVEVGQKYSIRFGRPAHLAFTKADVGDENYDSDVDPSTGETPAIHVEQDETTWDAGMVPDPSYTTPTPDPKHDPKPEVGPVRSGRLLYRYIAGFFQNSCLIYAFASPEVLSKLPHCAFVVHKTVGGGEMLTIDRMKAVAEDNMRHMAGRPFDYSSNVFSQTVPPNGLPASRINVFFESLNQSGWTYDPLYESYLRYVDTGDKNAPGVLHPEVDRLTGRQLHFENVIALMADARVVTPTNLDIQLDQGAMGEGNLFRNGEMLPIEWTTKSGPYEQTTGLRRPIRFLNKDGSAIALKPGHTWVIIVTPYSLLQEQSRGVYLLQYLAPAGEAR